MLYVFLFKWIPERASKTMFDASNKKAILKITYPFRKASVHRITPALQLKEKLETMGKMEI